jgi:Ca2+-binding RTX toxin-like protein
MSRSTPPSRPAVIEPMESRRLMSLTLADVSIVRATLIYVEPVPTYLSGSTLVVNGSTSGDNISIFQDPSNVIVNNRGTITSWSVAAVGSIRVNGGDGDDSITLNPGVNKPAVIYGGRGNDVIQGGDGNDCVYGGEGADQLDGRGGIDYLYGQQGNDALTGGAGADYLYGGDNNDTFYAKGDGSLDNIDGGLGWDVAYVDPTYTAELPLPPPFNVPYTVQGDYVSGVEQMFS